MEYGAGAAAGEFFQSLMEVGERVCLPHPDCSRCPLRLECIAHKGGLTGTIPVRIPRKKAQEMFWYFLLIRRNDSFYLVQNPRREFLKTAWLFPDLLSEIPLSETMIRNHFLKQWGIHIRSLKKLGSIRHSVTYRKITGHVLAASRCDLPTSNGVWLTREELDERHTSSVLHKILAILSESE
jgi:adenine-specific DNA glycosylase